MKYKLESLSIDMYIVVVCLILMICPENSQGIPVDYNDLDNLLPKIPRDKNETMEDVVQDPVIKDAVQMAAANGSLNGLVVRRKVFIMPATDPTKVISEREQLLVVPPEHLEDVRRNITESKEAETDDYVLLENQTLLEENVDEYTTEDCENSSNCKSSEVGQIFENESNNVASKNDDLRTEEEFLKSTVTQEIESPQGESKKVSIPIFAVVDPASFDDDKAESSLIAVLPNHLEDDISESQANYLKEHRRQIQKKAQEYIDHTSLTVDPESLRTLASSKIPSSNDASLAKSSLQSRDPSNIVTEEMIITPVVVPRFEIVAPVLQANDAEYSKETDDMDVAEDIIFRPLFRYRQEAQQRSKYRAEESNRRGYNYRRYNPYRTYDSYPRRNYGYKSRYDDYY